MSWDAYKDSLDGYFVAEIQKRGEQGPSKITHVGIFGSSDGNPWMSTQQKWSISSTPNEIKAIESSFSKVPNPLGATGIKLGSMKFMYLRNDDTTIYGKRKGVGFVSIYKSKTALLIAVSEEGAQAGDLNNAVSKLGSYLISSGY